MEYQINNDIEIEYYDKEREKNVWGRATVREYVPTGIRVQWYDTSSASSSSASSSTAGGLFEVLFTEDKRRMRHDKSMKLNKQLEEIRTRTEDGQFRTSTYRHMLGRLEGDRLLLDKQLERLQHLKKERSLRRPSKSEWRGCH